MTSDPRARPLIESPRLRELHAYWDDRRAGKPMPSRADIDPLDIPRLLPHLILVDVAPGTKRLRARLVGTKVVEMYGRDYTGEYFDEIDFGHRRAAIEHDYVTCLETRQPYVSEHSFWTTGGALFRSERLILPLSDDGTAVSMLLSALDFSPVR